MKKILTVSIAAYNVEKYLAQALESCVPAIEDLDIIVVNDGSKDGTLEIARMWELKYPDSIRVIDKPNGGYGSTINAAISVAEGKYFRYLDGDDWFDSGILPKYIELLSHCSHDAVITPYTRVYESGANPEVKDCTDYLNDGSHGIDELEPLRAIAAASIAYKTDLLKTTSFMMTEGCFYTDIEYAYLPMRYVESLNISRLSVYQYRIGREGQSVSVEGIKRHHSDIVRVCARLLHELGNAEGPSAKYLNGVLTKECCVAFRYLCVSGPGRKVKRELQKFDTLVRQECPSVYAQMEERSRLVSLLRKTRFFAWRFACARCQRRP